MHFLFLVITFLAVGSQAAVISYRDVLLEEWEEFKSTHLKNYENEMEDKFRLKVFMENKHKIAVHNKQALGGQHSYTLGMNKYGDLLHHEFVAIMNGLKRELKSNSVNGSTYLTPANVKIPDEVDWRKEGYVTDVKDQGQCGSCWSFSSTGSLEGQYMRKTGKLISLSEQNLIDCSTKYGNSGCSGGLMDNAFEYIRDNKGIDTEESYPYIAKDNEKCHYKKADKGASDTGFVDVPEDEDKLKEAVATQGPISTAMQAESESFQFYKSGVYDDTGCSKQVDHGILIVGYGTTDDNQDYWIVKNSWGKTWGDHGYFRIARNKNNMCGIGQLSSYPLV